MLGPIRRQRERQRGSMEETLRRQLGPGYESSSAGIEALTRFDLETDDFMAKTQESATLQLLGVASAARGQAQQSEQAAMNLGQRARETTVANFQTAKQRELSAFQGSSQNRISAGNQVTDAAGGAWGAVSSGFGDMAGIAGFAAGKGANSFKGGADAFEKGEDSISVGNAKSPRDYGYGSFIGTGT